MAEIADRSFEIDTIPRTGYRLTGATNDVLGPETTVPKLSPGGPVSRRGIIAGSAASVALGVGALWWWLDRPQTDPRFDVLMAKGDEASATGPRSMMLPLPRARAQTWRSCINGPSKFSRTTRAHGVSLAISRRLRLIRRHPRLRPGWSPNRKQRSGTP